MIKKENKNFDILRQLVEMILAEPDQSEQSKREDEKETDEINTVATVGAGGPMTPLGTGPSYPLGVKRRKKSTNKNKK